MKNWPCPSSCVGSTVEQAILKNNDVSNKNKRERKKWIKKPLAVCVSVNECSMLRCSIVYFVDQYRLVKRGTTEIKNSFN